MLRIILEIQKIWKQNFLRILHILKSKLLLLLWLNLFDSYPYLLSFLNKLTKKDADVILRLHPFFNGRDRIRTCEPNHFGLLLSREVILANSSTRPGYQQITLLTLLNAVSGTWTHMLSHLFLRQACIPFPPWRLKYWWSDLNRYGFLLQGLSLLRLPFRHTSIITKSQHQNFLCLFLNVKPQGDYGESNPDKWIHIPLFFH